MRWKEIKQSSKSISFYRCSSTLTSRVVRKRPRARGRVAVGWMAAEDKICNGRSSTGREYVRILYEYRTRLHRVSIVCRVGSGISRFHETHNTRIPARLRSFLRGYLCSPRIRGKKERRVSTASSRTSFPLSFHPLFIQDLRSSTSLFLSFLQILLNVFAKERTGCRIDNRVLLRG